MKEFSTRLEVRLTNSDPFAVELRNCEARLWRKLTFSGRQDCGQLRRPQAFGAASQRMAELVLLARLWNRCGRERRLEAPRTGIRLKDQNEHQIATTLSAGYQQLAIDRFIVQVSST
jgi:hypothetical protein